MFTDLQTKDHYFEYGTGVWWTTFMAIYLYDGIKKPSTMWVSIMRLHRWMDSISIYIAKHPIFSEYIFFVPLLMTIFYALLIYYV